MLMRSPPLGHNAKSAILRPVSLLKSGSGLAEVRAKLTAYNPRPLEGGG
jgi:hypothetical protein